jgi:hypothetical protein
MQNAPRTGGNINQYPYTLTNKHFETSVLNTDIKQSNKTARLLFNGFLHR